MLKGTQGSFKAIVWDVDGTLYANELMFLSAPHIYIRNFMWFFRFARMREKLRSVLKKSSDIALGKDSINFFHSNSRTLYAKEIGIEDEDIAGLLLEKHVYRTWIKAVSKISLRIGIRTLLGNLKRNGYAQGILSDFQSNKKIKNWNITKYFDSIICAEDWGVLKPDKRLFEKIAEDLSCKPEEIIFVGNHVKYDGVGALHAGFMSLLFYNNTSKITRRNLDAEIYHFKTMKGLKKALAEIGVNYGY